MSRASVEGKGLKRKVSEGKYLRGKCPNGKFSEGKVFKVWWESIESPKENYLMSKGKVSKVWRESDPRKSVLRVSVRSNESVRRKSVRRESVRRESVQRKSVPRESVQLDLKNFAHPTCILHPLILTCVVCLQLRKSIITPMRVHRGRRKITSIDLSMENISSE